VAANEAVVSTSFTRDYPLVAVRGEGSWIIDPDGNEFLDVTSGIAVTATGHCHPRVVAAIQRQAADLLHMSGTDFYYPAQNQLASALCARAPVNGAESGVRVFFGNSGTEGVECALKLARWATRRSYVLGFLGSFHGRTMGALSVTSSKVRQRERFGPMMPGVVHGLYADPYRMGPDASRVALAHIEELLATVLPGDELAAIVVEPIQGEGGYVVPPDAFLVGLRALCDRLGALLVFDEVQSGMGRTGRLWAFEHTPVRPDILVAAKGIASGLPLSATFASADVMKWPPGAHANTFGGNPLACVAALETLALLEESYIANAAAMGERLMGALGDAVGGHPHVGQVRGRGLMVGVELVADRTSRERAPQMRDRVVQEAFSRGLLLLGCGRNTIRFAPSLAITADEVDVAVELFAASLRAAC
jgi:4-aminobutyrate aminotransferase